jgi:hypothetical protein
MSLKKKIQLKSEFDLMIDGFKEELKESKCVLRRLTGVTNKNGIPLDWIRIIEGNRYNSGEIIYIVNFHKNKKKGDVTECDCGCEWEHGESSESEDEIPYTFSGSHCDNDLKKAIHEALIDANKWDRCQSCFVYSTKIMNHQCVGCILNAQIIKDSPPNEKFECVICKTEKLNFHKKTLKCGHDQFCLDCIKKLKKPECPLCRSKITSI